MKKKLAKSALFLSALIIGLSCILGCDSENRIGTIADIYCSIDLPVPCNEVLIDSVQYVSNRDLLRIEICDMPYLEITRKGDVYIHGKLEGKLKIGLSGYRIRGAGDAR